MVALSYVFLLTTRGRRRITVATKTSCVRGSGHGASRLQLHSRAQWTEPLNRPTNCIHATAEAVRRSFVLYCLLGTEGVVLVAREGLALRYFRIRERGFTTLTTVAQVLI